MLQLWIILAICAAFFQTLRTATQKHLVHQVDPVLASGARFIFGSPFALLALIILFTWNGLITPNLHFWLYSFSAVIVQIAASTCVTHLFKRKSFAIGNILTKTEIAFIPIISLILLNEHIALIPILALLISLIGTLFASLARIKNVLKSKKFEIDRGSLLLGCSAGFFFAMTTVCVRGATTKGFEDQVPALYRAIITVATVLTTQCILLCGWFKIRKPHAFIEMKTHLRPCIFNGLMSVSASFCWFFAYTLMSASFVKTVGQAEFLFTLALSYFYLKERITAFEWTGSVLIVISAFIILLY